MAGKADIQFCPICRDNPLPPEQILCTSCKADNPYNLLGGYSPTKKIYDELKKIGYYKDQISILRNQLRFTGMAIVVLCLAILAMMIWNWLA